MTKPARFRCLVVVALALVSDGFLHATPQTGSVPTKVLGPLEITVSKVEQYTAAGDRFDGGPISYYQFGYIYLHFKNVGDSRACVSLVPSVEEYKGSELQYTQQLQTGFGYNPKIQDLQPGRETSGYYEFHPSPQRRAYVLVLQQRSRTQTCGQRNQSRNVKMSDAPSVRFAVSGNTKPH
jgi:hypothetical protein